MPSSEVSLLSVTDILIEHLLLLLVEMGSFHGAVRKALSGTYPWEVECCGKTYWDKNRRLCPGSQCLNSICPTVENVQPCLHQAQMQGQCPMANSVPLVQSMSQLVQFSLCPHLVSSVLFLLHPASVMLLYPVTLGVHPVAGAQAAARPAWPQQRENMQCYWERERWGERERGREKALY